MGLPLPLPHNHDHTNHIRQHPYHTPHGILSHRAAPHLTAPHRTTRSLQPSYRFSYSYSTCTARLSLSVVPPLSSSSESPPAAAKTYAMTVPL